MNIFIGDKFYLRESKNDSLDLRIVRAKNENTFIGKRNDGNLVKITKQDLLKNYNRIYPHGTIFVSTVAMKDNVKDVLIALFRMEDIDNQKTPLPFAVCRQYITDLFGQTMNQNPNASLVGLSISQKTIPVDLNFTDTVGCEKIIETKKYNVYLDDTLDDILELIDKKYMERINYILKDLKDKHDDLSSYGYMETLEKLLLRNDFMFDFLSAWNITRVPFEIVEQEGTELLPNHRYEIEKIASHEMFKSYVIPYTYDINIKNIKRSHVIVIDKNNKTFIIAYDKGKHITDSYKDYIRRNEDIAMSLKGLQDLIQK